MCMRCVCVCVHVYHLSLVEDDSMEVAVEQGTSGYGVLLRAAEGVLALLGVVDFCAEGAVVGEHEIGRREFDHRRLVESCSRFGRLHLLRAFVHEHLERRRVDRDLLLPLVHERHRRHDQSRADRRKRGELNRRSEKQRAEAMRGVRHGCPCCHERQTILAYPRTFSLVWRAVLAVVVASSSFLIASSV